MILKISKKMQTLLAPVVLDGVVAEANPEFRPISAKVSEQHDAGRAEKDEAVRIDASDAEVELLKASGKARLAVLDAALAAAKEEEKRPFLGQHSAWSALLRGIEKQAA